MASDQKILIVDDNFEIALFLRTTLEIVLPDYQVVNVPSGEEGILEVSRFAYNLIISDLNLPGINGFEFIDKARKISPDIPVIIITGEKEPYLEQEAYDRDVIAFFPKPLDIDELTGAVRHALNGEPETVPDTAPKPMTEPVPLPPVVTERVNALRVDTGAQYAMLVDVHGHSLATSGRVSNLETAQVASLLSKELRNFYALSQLLRAPQPFGISYQAGAGHDLYTINVGENYLVALIFEGRRGRGQIGAVWVYARRSIKGLLDLLGAAAPPPAAPAEEIPAPPVPEITTPPLEETRASLPEEIPPPIEEAAPPHPIESPAPPPEPEELWPEPALQGGPLPPALSDAKPDLTSEQVDAFWDSVLSGEEAAAEAGGFGGISLADARAQGLIPSDFDLED